MDKLELCFRSKENSGKRRPPTEYEINELTGAIQGVAAITHVMAIYACDNPHGEEDDRLGVFGCIFNVLEWLVKPVNDYLFSYAGEPAVPKEEPEQTA
jgi:hypothetical protein